MVLASGMPEIPHPGTSRLKKGTPETLLLRRIALPAFGWRRRAEFGSNVSVKLDEEVSRNFAIEVCAERNFALDNVWR